VTVSVVDVVWAPTGGSVKSVCPTDIDKIDSVEPGVVGKAVMNRSPGSTVLTSIVGDSVRDEPGVVLGIVTGGS
jgi:hypothetical protein